ncbi:MAG: hypothetical protein PHF57_09265, partial [Methanoregula sp.]|nr:hypothetical protein [Methanoregula sp.]
LTPSDKDALSDYGTLPKPIEGFTTQELVDELSKRDIHTFLECPYREYRLCANAQCRHSKGCYNSCDSNLKSGDCPMGYAR